MIQDSKVVTRIDLDVSLPDVQKGVSITQGDTNRRWIFSLTNGGEPLEVPARWTAVLTGTKPDGTLIYNGTIVENGQIVYDFSSGEQPGTVVGTYPLQLEIYNIGGELVFSPKMWVRVFPHMSATEAAQSTNEFTAVSQFVADKNEVIARVEKAELAVKEADERAAGYLKDISSIKSDLQNKAQKATTLAGYGITDAYTKEKTDELLDRKATKTTTLRGYGITDAYRKDEVDSKVDGLRTGKGSSVEVSMNPNNYQMTVRLKNEAGEVLSEGMVDLPLESLVLGTAYADGILTLKIKTADGTLENSEVQVNISDIIDGLVSEAVFYAALEKMAAKATTLAGYGITDAYTKEEAAAFIGDMDAVLDELHAYAEALKGGDAS